MIAAIVAFLNQWALLIGALTPLAVVSFAILRLIAKKTTNTVDDRVVEVIEEIEEEVAAGTRPRAPTASSSATVVVSTNINNAPTRQEAADDPDK